MGLQERLLEDMKDAMKSGDKVVLETIRMVRSQMKNASITRGNEYRESKGDGQGDGCRDASDCGPGRWEDGTGIGEKEVELISVF